jgi:hypothetical protein
MDSTAAGEGQRFKRIPRQSCARNLELDPLVCVCHSLLQCVCPCFVDLVVRMPPLWCFLGVCGSAYNVVPGKPEMFEMRRNVCSRSLRSFLRGLGFLMFPCFSVS